MRLCGALAISRKTLRSLEPFPATDWPAGIGSRVIGGHRLDSRFYGRCRPERLAVAETATRRECTTVSMSTEQTVVEIR